MTFDLDSIERDATRIITNARQARAAVARRQEAEAALARAIEEERAAMALVSGEGEKPREEVVNDLREAGVSDEQVQAAVATVRAAAKKVINVREPVVVKASSQAAQKNSYGGPYVPPPAEYVCEVCGRCGVQGAPWAGPSRCASCAGMVGPTASLFLVGMPPVHCSARWWLHEDGRAVARTSPGEMGGWHDRHAGTAPCPSSAEVLDALGAAMGRTFGGLDVADLEATGELVLELRPAAAPEPAPPFDAAAAWEGLCQGLAHGRTEEGLRLLEAHEQEALACTSFGDFLAVEQRLRNALGRLQVEQPAKAKKPRKPRQAKETENGVSTAEPAALAEKEAAGPGGGLLFTPERPTAQTEGM